MYLFLNSVVAMAFNTLSDIEELIGKDKAFDLLSHQSNTILKDKLYIPSPNFVDDVFCYTNRSIPVMRNLQATFNHGRLGGTGYLSILPVDQGIEHSAGASFSLNPHYFDPKYIIELAIEGGCNAVATTLGNLGSVARKYAHKIPMILKINHNELLTLPNRHDQILFASVEQAWELGAVGVGATIYFGSNESSRQIEEISAMFERSHELGMFTVLWCYLRNPGFTKDEKDYHSSADLTGQANHMGVTIGADIIKQKLPTIHGGYQAVTPPGESYGKTHPLMYSQMGSTHPIDMVRYQVAHNYMGRIGLINSGGASGKNDLVEAVRTAVINKRGGGMGLISGRKAFQKPLKEGIELLNAIQDIYLSDAVTIA